MAVKISERFSRYWWVGLFGFALAVRLSMFGSLNYLNDELFYFLVGQEIVSGSIPYVDIWDRKPPGLLYLFALFASISHNVLSYQVAAWLFAAGTASLIGLIVRQRHGIQSAVLSGMLYLALLPAFGGGGGQAEVFGNFFIAIAAWLVLRRSDWAAMLAAGIAISIKQTAFFPGVAFGLIALWRRYRADEPLTRPFVILSFVGALPMLAFSVYFVAIGHWPEFFHAMAGANIDRAYRPVAEDLNRLRIIAGQLTLVIVIIALGWRMRDKHLSRFALLWLFAAIVGFFAVPNLIGHYLLPILAPLCILAAPFMAKARIGLWVGLVVISVYIFSSPTLDFRGQRQSTATIKRIASDLDGRVYVFSGPVYLYALAGERPPSPLVFPSHLFWIPDLRASHLDARAELDRIFAWQPNAVVSFQRPAPAPVSPYALQRFNDYTARCKFRETATLDYADYRADVVVYMGC